MPKSKLELLSIGHLLVCLLWLALVSLTSFAQQAQRTDRPSPLTLPIREALARPLLLHAESVSATFDPASHSLVLYRSAGAWLPLDHSHAIRLYRESFAAARESAPTIRHYLEEAILNDLLPLSPPDVLDLLPGAVPATKTRLYAALINFSLLQNDYVAAVRVFERAASDGVLPLRATAHLLAGLPTSASAECTNIFTTAMQFYQAHPDREQPWHWTIADLVARFYKRLPDDLVLQAIHIALTQSEEQNGGQLGMGAGEHNIAFHSNYDFQLFAVAPALQQLDPALAARLLAQHAEAAANLRRYPEGLPSFYEGDPYLGKDGLAPNHQKPVGLQLYNTIEEAQNLKPMDMGLEFTVPRNLNLLGVTGSSVSFAPLDSPEAAVLGSGNSCPSDLVHSLELARAVPVLRKLATVCNGPIGGQWCSYTDTFPRVSVIQVLAERCTYSGDSARARVALQEQLEIVEEIPEEHRIAYLATAADLYLRIGDPEAATRVIEKGFTAARGLYDREIVSPQMQGFPEGMWNSAEAFRRMITLGVNASMEVTLKAVSEIPDPSLRELEQVMIARGLLGVPVRRNMTASVGSFCTVETEVTYEQL